MIVSKQEGTGGMKKGIHTAIIAAVVLIIAAVTAYFLRPMTIEERYPYLDMEHCTQIWGYYGTDLERELVPFVIRRGDPQFEQAMELFRPTVFRFRLGSLFSSGIKIHKNGLGDFRWEANFQFDRVVFPNGDTGRGDILHVTNFYGDIELSCDGEQMGCNVDHKEQWLKDVLTLLKQCGVE